VKRQTARQKIVLRGKRCLGDLPFSPEKLDENIEQAMDKMNKLNEFAQKLVFEVHSGDKIQ